MRSSKLELEAITVANAKDVLKKAIIIEFTTKFSIRSKYKNNLALLTKKSCSNFKRILKTKGGTVINRKVMDMSGLLSVRNSKNIAKTRLVKSKIEPKSL